MYSDKVERDTMAKKAVVLPMLIRSSSTAIDVSRRSALSGMWRVELTREKTFENGKPLSLAKAQVSRDTEVRVLKRAIMPRYMIIAMSTAVAA